MKFSNLNYLCFAERVAPLVGAWIEIDPEFDECQEVERSLPLWERGLKYEYGYNWRNC